MDAPPPLPSVFPGNDIGPRDDVDFDQGEAMLSQMLLRNLDSEMDLSMATQQQRESAAVGLGLGLGIGFADLAMDSAKREKIIMTCERRGSESTITSSHNSHSYSPSSPSFLLPPHLQRHRFTHDSTGSATTLYEPSSPVSPSWKEKALELPPISPVRIVRGQEHCSPPSPGCNVSVYGSPAPTTETEMQSPVPEDPNLEQDARSDDDATRHALSPS
jgi:hypothetical protein